MHGSFYGDGYLGARWSQTDRVSLSDGEKAPGGARLPGSNIAPRISRLRVAAPFDPRTPVEYSRRLIACPSLRGGRIFRLSRARDGPPPSSPSPLRSFDRALARVKRGRGPRVIVALSRDSRASEDSPEIKTSAITEQRSSDSTEMTSDFLGGALRTRSQLAGISTARDSPGLSRLY